MALVERSNQIFHRVEQQKNSLMAEMNDTRAAVEELTMEKVCPWSFYFHLKAFIIYNCKTLKQFINAATSEVEQQQKKARQTLDDHGTDGNATDQGYWK